MINLIFILFLLLLIIIFLKLIIKRENFENTDRRCMSSDSCFGDYNHSIIYPKTSDCLEKCLVEHSRNIEYKIGSHKKNIFDYSYDHKKGDETLILEGEYNYDWTNAPKTNKLISEIGITSIDNETDLLNSSTFGDGWEFVTNKQPIINNDGTNKYLVVKKVPYLYDAITEEGPIWEDKKIDYITNIHIVYGLNGNDISNDKNISEVKNDTENKHIIVKNNINFYIYPEYGLHENNDQPLLDIKFSDNVGQKEGFSIVTKSFLINNETKFPQNNNELGYKCSGDTCNQDYLECIIINKQS